MRRIPPVLIYLAAAAALFSLQAAFPAKGGLPPWPARLGAGVVAVVILGAHLAARRRETPGIWGTRRRAALDVAGLLAGLAGIAALASRWPAGGRAGWGVGLACCVACVLLSRVPDAPTPPA